MKLKKWRRLLTKKNEIVIGLISATLILTSIFILWIASLRLPDLGSFESRKISQSTKIYDRTGAILLYDINEGIRRTIVKSVDISRDLKNAVVAIEDAEFYEHSGIKPTAFIRAVIANLISAKYSQGGSTITQQVIKNALLTKDKKVARKIKEWILSLKLEKVMSKDEILTLYLNDAPYGGNIYGAEEASKTFFGKSATEITLAEAAYLAALPNAPSFYSPYGGNKSALEKRKNLVLSKMFEYKFITDKEYELAKKEVVVFNPYNDRGIKAPHFVMYIKGLLEKQYGVEVMQSNGFKVITTLDYSLEKKAEEIVKQYATENSEKYNASNASITAIDATNGDILVMVGSRDYFDPDIDGNFNIATANRQPGSTFKPFVYSAAFQKGYTPETMLFDLKTEFSTECNPDGTPIKAGDENKCYMPENYDEKYRGPISLREALAQSINIPAIKTLYLAGIRNSVDLANNMGIKSLDEPDRYGLTLVLGGGEVSLLELTGAYSVFANDGVKNEPHGILKIEDAEGKIVYSYSSNPKLVLEKNVARKITDILSDNNARAPAFGLTSPLYFSGYDVAAKTGTTNDYRDAWIIGYTPQVSVGAWAGNNDNSPMEKKVAGFIVAPMWNTFMKEVLAAYPAGHFKKPDDVAKTDLKPVLRGYWQGGETYFTDTRTGTMVNQYTPNEYRQENIITNIHTILYWLNKNDPLGPKPEHPENDSQFNLWEEPIKKWVSENNISAETPKIKQVETISQPIKKIEPLKISFISPKQGVLYLPGNRLTIDLAITGDRVPIRVEFYVNGQFIGSSVSTPFSLSFVPKELPVLQKYNNVKVVAYGASGEKTEAGAMFTVQF